MGSDSHTPLEELINKIAEVSIAVGWQAGVGASETAGMIVSCLANDPTLIPRFMTEGSGMLVDGTITTERGCLTYMDQSGAVRTPGFLAAHKQVQRIKRAVLSKAGGQSK